MTRHTPINRFALAATLSAAALLAMACSKADEGKKPTKAPPPAAKTTAPGTDKAPPAPAAARLAEAAGSYKVDGGHSYAIFRIGHFGVSYQYGSFNKISGAMTIDGADPTKSNVSIEIAAGSVFTADKKRDTHIKGPDFLDVKQFPKVTFKSTAVEAAGGDKYNVTGDLTMHGVTRSVTIPLDYVGSGKDPWGGFRAGFEGKLTIKRSDFGMKFMLEALGDEIELTLAVEGIKS